MDKTKKHILIFLLILTVILYFTVFYFFNNYNPCLHLIQRSLQKTILFGFLLLAFSGSLLIIKFSKGKM